MERTILVAEDSRTQAVRLRLLLEGAGYRVDVASNGREALERAGLSRPDLIVSDIAMPGMDGYELCRALKSAEALRRIPFVLLTERHAPTDIIKGFQCGADNFITKPFEDEQLLERFQRIFSHLELRQGGRLDVEITLGSGGQQVVINPDKQQMIELLFSTLDDLVRLSGQLAESQRVIEGYARTLETQVQERTQQLVQTEKIATMGMLLAGVAHELNNPLSVVKGQADLLRLAVAQGPLAARVEKIGQAAERCARIVRNFLSLARQYPPELKATALNQLVHEAVELLGYQLRTVGIEVRLDLARDLPLLWADPHQLHQVLVNLITNAQQAMRKQPGPKHLVLATRAGRGGERVVLEVADTGPRDRRRRPGEDLRAVLHHQGGGGGNRPRAAHLPRDRRGPRRHADGDERAGARGRVHDGSSRRPGRDGRRTRACKRTGPAGGTTGDPRGGRRS